MRCFACVEPGAPPIPFEPPDPDPVPHPDVRYFARALAAMEERLGRRDLTVYVTWSTDELPSYGDDVVAVVLGDEPARIPRYFDRVAATFKGYGTRPPIGVRPAALPSRLGAAALLEWAEKLAICAPGALAFARRRVRSRALPGVFPVPIGYFEQEERPVTPILERPVDVFFAGSVQHVTPRRLPSAKGIAREQMLAALESAHGLTTDLQLFTGFGPGTAGSLSREEYSTRLMDARICLAPRGNSVETFRVFEGMRYGCVVLCDPLPRGRWFYDGAPVVEVARWSRLPRILEALLADERALAERQAATLAWWRDRCSEEALGAYMAERVPTRA